LSETPAQQPETASAPAEPEARRAPWRGRPRAANRRDRVLRTRVSTPELDQLTARATEAGLSVGAFVRAAVFGNAGPRAVRRPPVERAQLARLLGEMGKLGSNVNQIARRLNATGDRPGAPEIDQMRGEIAAMRAMLMQALGRGD
jgi:Bacterial mobilisation protein (MobC)